MLTNLAAGIISSDEVETLAVCWPQLYAQIMKATISALGKLKALRPKWEPGHRQEVDLGILLQTSTGLRLDLAMELQRQYAAQKQPDPNYGVGGGGTSRDSREPLLPGQRLDA